MDKSNNTNLQSMNPTDSQLREEIELDEFYHMPKELWPEDATEIDFRPCYLWTRKSKWKTVTAVNERNKKLVEECAEFYKSKRPGTEDPLKEDEFWLNCVGDAIIAQSLSNRDYMYEADYKDMTVFKSALKQYDVVFQETLGGFVCHPFVVYDIRYRYNYYAYINYDDYARQKIEEYEKEWDFDRDGKKHPYNEERERKWREYGYKDEKKLKVQLIKDGHTTFTVKTTQPEYEMHMRWVNHSNEIAKGEGILHKGNY